MTNIKDIALHCGVAISTVSRVLNDHPDVSEETREKVRRAVNELHYIPNTSARNLVRTSYVLAQISAAPKYWNLYAQIVERALPDTLSARNRSEILLGLALRSSRRWRIDLVRRAFRADPGYVAAQLPALARWSLVIARNRLTG